MGRSVLRSNWACFSFFLSIFFLLLAASPGLRAQTISGTVRDPTGAVIPGAGIEIAAADQVQSVTITSDDLGRFTSPTLKPGAYTIKVSREGFEPLTQSVTLKESLQLQLTLTVAGVKTTVSVPGGVSPFLNSDPVYRSLRWVGLGESYRAENVTVTLDVATFHLRDGTLTFLAPVNGVITGAIFIGDGEFHLKPVTVVDSQELARRASAPELNEEFTEVVFRFASDSRTKLFPDLGGRIDTPASAAAFLDHWRQHMRHRQETPTTITQYLLEGESMDNIDADLTAALLNPNHHPAFCNVYIHGKKHKDLRFFLRKRVGAIPQLDSPEEVGLVNYDPNGLDDGIWYLSHLRAEFQQGTANSSEDRRLFATHSYTIETVIAKNGHLFCTATIAVEPLIDGERVLKFDLLPNLRVSGVLDDQGQGIHFIQESRKEDGSFYVILPQAPPLGKEFSLSIEYAGDKVLETAGEGSYYVQARTSWYPNLNGFGEHALYDLTFKVPKKYKVISIGRLERESTEDNLAVTHWVTPVPVAVAGFNYGEYQKLDIQDDLDGYKLTGYYLTELPNSLHNYSALQNMAPKSMTHYALEQARAQMQLCTNYFGKIPYRDISVTEQPDFNFGQSWPNLVYLPISAYTDSTQRWMLFGNIDSKFTGFVQEVTPHEVSHQWWGHAVSWASYHDQWLSEGFADFSAGLFLQQGVAGDWRKDYIEYWERLRKRALEKNSFGIAANDAGPLWLGLRLDSPRSPRAYQDMAYPKGAYVLQMIRSMMWDMKDHDKAFIDMMHDFVASHQTRAASTETFKAVVEKHMTKQMDLESNGHLDWFFNEWVYGTMVPRYHLDYQVSPADSGHFKVHVNLTQSEVNDHFAMIVPIYGDFGKGMVHLVQVAVAGNNTRSFDIILPAEPKKVTYSAYKDILER
jgi:hypothetical protein